MVETASRAQCLVFAQVADSDLRVFFALILDEVTEDRLFIVADNKDLLDVCYLGYCVEAVLNDWVTGDFE